jgi:glutamyl-Q tRNA(Asp) synthetase
MNIAYMGRFAPSPTGPLHFGSLVTALASWCEARQHGGQWLIRIEDTDIPRNQAGAEAEILAALHRFGLTSDAPILRQSERLDHYNTLIDQLHRHGLVYGCACSRKQLSSNPSPAYPNTCRDLGLPLSGNAVRLRVPDQAICFDDQLQGQVCENLQHTTGDVVLRRRDGIISYQLAVVVDDIAQGVTDIVRGADLLDNTARQIWLRHCLRQIGVQDVIEPRYTHLPLAMNDQGQKLSKQNLAAALELDDPLTTLRLAFAALGQLEVDADSVAQFLQRAVAVWDMTRIRKGVALAGTYF